jgi:argininosuccinate lyase
MALALSIGTFVQDVHAQYHHSRPWVLLDSNDLLSPSTLMPQKRNPVALNRARLLASEVVGDGVSTAFAAHNVSSGLTDYKRGEAARTLDRTIALLAEVNAMVGALRLDEEAALLEVRSDYSTTSELANILQRQANIPFHIGHRFASALVTHGRAAHLTPDDIAFSDVVRLYGEVAAGFPNVTAEFPLTERQFRQALDPEAMVRSYQGSGGPQPGEVAAMLAEARDALHTDMAWTADVASQLRAAEDRLEAHFNALTSAT